MSHLSMNTMQYTMHDFQKDVGKWIRECFGFHSSMNISERNHRFLEEALELVQAGGCTKIEALQLVDYTFGREKGVVSQTEMVFF